MLGGLVTIENLMYLGGGLLVAWLVALPVVPLVHERAVRLTRRKTEDARRAPERQLAQAMLRADLAASTRNLERRIADMTEKSAEQMRALAAKRAEIERLRQDIAAREDAIAALQRAGAELEARERGAFAERDTARAQGAAAALSLQRAQDEIAALRAEMAGLTAALDRRIGLYNRQAYEIATLSGRRPAPGRAAPGSATHTVPQSPADDRDAIARALQAVLAESAQPPSRALH